MAQQYSGPGNQYPGGYSTESSAGPATNGPVTGAAGVPQPYYHGSTTNSAGNHQQVFPPRPPGPGGVSTGPPMNYSGVPGKTTTNYGASPAINYGPPSSQYGSAPSQPSTSNPGANSSLGPPPSMGRPPSQQGQPGPPLTQAGPSGGRPPSQGQPNQFVPPMGQPATQTMGSHGQQVQPARPPSQPGQFGPPMGQATGPFGPSMGPPTSQPGHGPPSSQPGPQMGRPPSQQSQPGPAMGLHGQSGSIAGPQAGVSGPGMYNHRPPAAVNGLHSSAGQTSGSFTPGTFTPGTTQAQPGQLPGVVRPPQPMGPPSGLQGGPFPEPAGGLVRPPPMTQNSFSTGGAPPLTNNISAGQHAGQAPPRGPQPGPPPPSVFNSTAPLTAARPGMPPNIRGPPPMGAGSALPRVGGFGPPLSTVGGANTLGPPPATSAANRPGELPMPYHGQGQFSHQNQTDLATPSGSDLPGSHVSSRSHTPQQPNYDLLEGQFTPSTSGPPSVVPPQQQPQFYSNQQPQYQQQPGMPPVFNQQQAQGSYPPQFAYSPQNPQAGIAPPANTGGYGPPTPANSGSYASPVNSGGYGPPTSTPAGVGGIPSLQPPSQQKPHYPSPATGHHHQPQQGYLGATGVSHPGALVPGLGAMNLQDSGSRSLNLLQERQIMPAEGVEQVVPNLPQEYKKCNCSPEVMSCTLNTIPTTQSLLNKSRLPLGVLIHPFKDLSQLPVIQSTVIVRCRSCRTYINPFVSFVDARRWKCNLCFRVNDLPDEFNYDPVSKSYGDPQRRPEIKSGTIEFIAPTEYMLRPPQPAVYLFLLDVSFNAMDTGYLPLFCQTLVDELDRIPGDSRTLIGFLAYDTVLYYFGLNEKTSLPQVYVISDLEEVLLPHPDDLLVNLHENKARITELLERLPGLFEKNMETGSALGPALSAAYKLMQPTGGRVTVMQTMLPSVGEGALKCREDPNERAGTKVQNLAPVTDFYKKLALDCSGQQIAVDVFMLSSQYSDISTVACISKYSAGSVHYFPGFHTASNPSETDRYENSLRRYLTRKIGFEAVMRIRCTKGLSIHTFHGNFFVRSTDLLSLPNINPEAGFGMQLSIDDTIESNYVCFQAALLYTSSKAERRIRVHTLCVPVTSQLSEIHAAADQKSIVALLAKMAVDKSVSSSLGDAREAMINSVVDMLNSYSTTLNAAQRVGQVPCPYQLRLVPLYVIAMLKSMAFRVGTSTKLDERVYAQEICKTLPTQYLLLMLYPNLYPIHSLDDKNALVKDGRSIPQPPRLPLSAAHVDRHGAYVMDTGDRMYVWVGAAVSDQFCQDVLDAASFHSIVDGLTELPALENATSERVRSFIQYLNEQRPIAASVQVVREDSRQRMLFVERLIEDRTESSLSYVEFLQHIQKELKS